MGDQEVSNGVDGGTVLQAAGECRAFLGGTLHRDWSLPIPDMDWTVAQAVAHIGEVLLWYATELAAGPRQLSAMDLRAAGDPSGGPGVGGARCLRHRAGPGDPGRGARRAAGTRPGSPTPPGSRPCPGTLVDTIHRGRR